MLPSAPPLDTEAVQRWCGMAGGEARILLGGDLGFNTGSAVQAVTLAKWLEFSMHQLLHL